MVSELQKFIFGFFSILGGAIVIVGLYLLLWGKEGDQEAQVKSQEESYSARDLQGGHKTQIITSAEELQRAEP